MCRVVISPVCRADGRASNLEPVMPVLHDEPDMYIHMVSKSEWKAKPIKVGKEGELKPLDKKVPYVRYTYTGMDKCRTLEGCTKEVQQIQEKDIEHEGLTDIRYNFLIGGDGKVYEGRGWTHDAVRPPAYEKLNGRCIDIAYMGDFANEHPTWEMLKAGLDILKNGLKNENISPCFEIVPYKDDNIEKQD